MEKAAAFAKIAQKLCFANHFYIIPYDLVARFRLSTEEGLEMFTFISSKKYHKLDSNRFMFLTQTLLVVKAPAVKWRSQMFL